MGIPWRIWEKENQQQRMLLLTYPEVPPHHQMGLNENDLKLLLSRSCFLRRFALGCAEKKFCKNN
jgi:hypothetical protein